MTSNNGLSSVNSSFNGSFAFEEFYQFHVGMITSLGFIGLFTNILVIKVVYSNSKLQNTPSYLIIHLAIADILSSCQPIVVGISLMALANRNWPHHIILALCRVAFYWWLLGYSLSVGMLTLISIERYRAIIQPMKLRLAGKQLNTILMFIWLTCLCISLPITVAADVDPVYYFDCRVEVNLFPTFIDTYFTAITAIVYFIPLIIISFCYTCVVRKLRKDDKQVHQLKRTLTANQILKKKIMRMLILVTLNFMVSSLPWIISLIMIAYYGISPNDFYYSQDKFLTVIAISIKALFSSLPITNSLIYFMTNPTIQQKVLLWLTKHKVVMVRPI